MSKAKTKCGSVSQKSGQYKIQCFVKSLSSERTVTVEGIQAYRIDEDKGVVTNVLKSESADEKQYLCLPNSEEFVIENNDVFQILLMAKLYNKMVELVVCIENKCIVSAKFN